MAIHSRTLLPATGILRLDNMNATGDGITITASTTQPGASCPQCGHPTSHLHSRYQRTIADLPWQGIAVRFRLLVRKFFCDNAECERRIFTEPLPQITARYARKTTRLTDALQELAFLVGGGAAARIATRFGLTVSPPTLLRQLKLKAPPIKAPRVLGIDDFAFKKGHRYGTILVDLEKRRPVDLLPDRNAESVEKWLRENPGVEIVSRDRAEVYRNGVTAGAPDAIQVADRWHLLRNLGDALEKVTARNVRHFGRRR